MNALLELLTRRGAVGSDSGGPAHYGDPGAEYQAATGGAAIFYRADRSLLRVHGKAPGQMLNGIVTNRIPAPPGLAGDLEGEVVYGAMLTPKGRMITDLRMAWLGPGEEEGFGLDVSSNAREPVLEYFGRVLPPRFARVVDLAADVGLLTVAGVEARRVIEGALGVVPDRSGLIGGGPLKGGVLVSQGVEQIPSFDLWTVGESLPRLWETLEGEGALPAGWDVWETLRVEAGFPAFGSDMDDGTLPNEVGLEERAFDHQKGCYTGQEVVVRILHRGHVNWHLRGLRFGESAPVPGDSLFEVGGAKAVGRVTSWVRSPRFGEVIGLGYVRREFDPPATLGLGSGDGPPVRVEALPRSDEG